MSLGFHLTRYFIVSLAKMKIMTLNFLMFIPLTYFINFCSMALAGTQRMMFKINGNILFTLLLI